MLAVDNNKPLYMTYVRPTIFSANEASIRAEANQKRSFDGSGLSPRYLARLALPDAGPFDRISANKNASSPATRFQGTVGSWSPANNSIDVSELLALEPFISVLGSRSRAEAIEIALGIHHEGQLDLAEQFYAAILGAYPDDPEAMHLLGILMHQRDGSDRALDLLYRSVELLGDRADWYNDLGNVLAARQQPTEAAEAFIRALTLVPNDAVVWNNLGAMLQRAGQSGDAVTAFRQAIELSPEFLDALDNLANLLVQLGQHNEAAEFFCRGYVVGPLHDKPKDMLGVAYYKLGRIADAADVSRQWLADEPDNAKARHLYAACSRLHVPARAADDYVEQIFDACAESFDSKLMDQLGYRGHAMIAHALAQVARPDRQLNALDAGCGTGLCGAHLSPFVRRLTGIDLSSRMLDMARQRGCYDELVKSELCIYLAAHPHEFDLLTIADTLIYFGDLEPVFSLAHAALRNDGLMILTIEEALEAPLEYQLNPSGRYSHGRAYLQATLAACGFSIMTMQSAVLRVEFGQPQNGLALAVRKSNYRPISGART